MLPAERQREVITGQIGPREREYPARKGADVGQGTNRPRALTTGARWRTLETAFGAVNRPTGSVCSTRPVVVPERLAWEPRTRQRVSAVLRRGEYREVPTYATAQLRFSARAGDWCAHVVH
jgi:hypothetical protein